MEVKMCGKTETMHCIRCGGIDFEKVDDYDNHDYQWFYCKECGLQFRPDYTNKNDPEIYLDHGILHVEKEK